MRPLYRLCVLLGWVTAAFFLPFVRADELLQFGGFLLADARLPVFVLLPSELVELLRRVWGAAFFAVGEHAGEPPLQGARVFPQRMVAAAQSGEIAVDFPPLHTVEKIVGLCAALAHDYFVEFEGGQAFFGSSGMSSFFVALSGM